MLAFGPDGYLYISMGDGGSGGDPDGNGQDVRALLGKLLRIDVNRGDPYGIPESNPFATRSDAAKEVWAYGLRNPWRFTFDRETGDMWIADVGQNKYEEIHFQAAGSKGGENYGWNIMEGDHCYKPPDGCKQDGLVKPVFEYDHGDGCSVTGGYLYRGKAIAALVGRYIFTDYCIPTLWLTTRSSDGKFSTIESGELPNGVSSFGEDEAGELYITVDQQGAVYRLVAK
jgi:glucose/arabinose dehydrogenase